MDVNTLSFYVMPLLTIFPVYFIYKNRSREAIEDALPLLYSFVQTLYLAININAGKYPGWDGVGMAFLCAFIDIYYVIYFVAWAFMHKKWLKVRKSMPPSTYSQFCISLFFFMLFFVLKLFTGGGEMSLIMAISFGAGGFVHLIIINIWRLIERIIKKFFTSEKTKL